MSAWEGQRLQLGGAAYGLGRTYVSKWEGERTPFLIELRQDKKSKQEGSKEPRVPDPRRSPGGRVTV
jgi:hypothetical protein